MNCSSRDINRAILSYKKNITAFARDIIRIPSFSTKEGKLVVRIKKEMLKVGFDRVKVDRMGNIIGFIGSGKKKIMMDAHIDTVGIGDRSAWKIDPFGGVLKNGVIYGRGATDQKLSMASMVYAGKAIKELGLEGDYTLMVVGSMMEEDCDGLPLLHLIKKEKLKPDFVVITEPTNLAVYRGHRGRMEMKVVTKGRSCHASAPERGDNAVVKMADITKEITALNKKLKHDKFIGKGTVAVTCIECKTPSYNAVPDECTIYLDRRLTIGETLKSSVAEIKRLPSVKKAGAKVEVLYYDATAWTGLKVGQEKYFPTWVLPESHKLVQAGVKAGTVALGKRPVVDKWVFSTNGVASAGRLGIPTIGFGPSNEIYAHTVNENMPVDHLLKAAVFYAVIPQYL
ncbi:MAG: selenium metabolism hydrolase [Elusimicrobia bacterium GWC2_51_8]|nr:MAG: selenium metabolism hydrolase [Elusimicrobia bacterium GWA2_51_34]OGR61786.1 MAG: selenium metabolism hydrolase [Elusimicrobia bacterium GWC2_51_8]OGR86383.1 MAG: selenium metabolism hydrolase [Elusimicrobia bacterium GWF2_52_66]HAF96198.1 YgeY family selenium metabolism-linked hydrolase [Elusimicrobiota bacterium]HCE97809.1 YgeY family selenium metabolism-linked hydrolase [Elusimicrobiota bacterium]